KEPVITLKADHTALLTDVPDFDGDDLVCRLSGSAHWKLDDELNTGWGWSVVFEDYHPATKPKALKCDYENSIWGILILGRHAPYRLYAIVGDPDSGTGIELKRTDR